MRDIPASPRVLEIKRKNRSRIIRKIILSFLFLLVFIFGAAYFSRLDQFKIKSIETEGLSVIDENEIIDYINNKISGKYFYLFEKSNFFIYPQNEIYEGILKDFVRVEKLSIDNSVFNTLKIKIKERSGVYLYCGESIPKEEDMLGENCYFVNGEGYVFDKAPYFSGDIYFKFYLKKEKDNPIDTNILESEDFVKIIKFIENIESIGLSPVYIKLNKGSDNYVFLEKRENDKNPFIVWLDEDPLDIVFENLSLAMSKSEFANEINSKYDLLSYIDLRFDNKVIYKFE